MPQVRHIFVDLDGVLADFVTAALTLHGRVELCSDWPPGLWNIHTKMGITHNEFWQPIDVRGSAFWATLEPFPWTFELMGELRRIAPVTIASKPSDDPASLDGKLRWLQRHFGPKFRDFLIGPPKHLLAHPDTALIDDNDRNVRDFVEHRGIGVLFPQPWNANHAHTADRVAFSLELLGRGRASPPTA